LLAALLVLQGSLGERNVLHVWVERSTLISKYSRTLIIRFHRNGKFR
jgi:hypothetical protein